MAETGRLAAWLGAGKGFEIREYPVPDPKLGARPHQGRDRERLRLRHARLAGDQDMEKRGRTLPSNTGHEHMGPVHTLGEGVTTDSAGSPSAWGIGYLPLLLSLGRCRACLRRQFRRARPASRTGRRPATSGPSSRAGRRLYYFGPARDLRIPDAITDGMVAGINCAFTRCMRPWRSRVRAGRMVVIQGAVGSGSSPARWPARLGPPA